MGFLCPDLFARNTFCPRAHPEWKRIGIVFLSYSNRCFGLPYYYDEAGPRHTRIIVRDRPDAHEVHLCICVFPQYDFDLLDSVLRINDPADLMSIVGYADEQNTAAFVREGSDAFAKRISAACL